MKIKSVHIKNVRGLGDHKVELNMIPNKPSILVAPNGSGKSSFALAFQWLNRIRMKLVKEDAYMGNENNSPSMVIETLEPNMTLVADENRNDITKQFEIYVINSSLTAALPGVLKGGYAMGKPHLSIPEVVLIDDVPANALVVDDFVDVYSLTNAPVGYYPAITDFLSDNKFMAKFDVDVLKCTKRPMAQINNFIERSKSYKGIINARLNIIESDDYNCLISIPAVKFAVDKFRLSNPSDSKAKLLLRAIRLVTLYNRKKDEFDARIVYAKYKKHDMACREQFAYLKPTWNEIAPHKVGNKISLKIGDAKRISNGERDIIVFLANLYKAKSKFTKENNILIIDEVFDYLDDANLMAAQFYITQMIKELREEGKNIFPIIMSHINPDFYNQHYSFKDLKVYYLCPLPHPHASDNMMKLLRKRKELSKAIGPGNEEDISKYMLHFYKDYSKDMSNYIGDCPSQWANINIFKQYCMEQLDAYLNNNTYDTLGVCVALREIIESREYSKLQTEEQKDAFLSKRGTPNKLEYAEEQGVDVPEIYFLLGNIYNDPLHVDNKSNKLVTQTLYSRLENNTIRGMIKNVKNNDI